MPDDLASTKRFNRRTPTVIACFVVGGLLAMAGLLVFLGAVPQVPQVWWPHIVTVAFLFLLGGEAFYFLRRERRRKDIEANFPGFLRSLATNHAAGLTLAASIRSAADNDHGALNGELRRMKAQLGFNAPLDEVLSSFAQRAESPLVTRSIALLQDAMRAGNSTTDALSAAATDATRMQDMAEVRQANLNQYAAIVYVSFAVFILVVIVLARYFVATVFRATTDADTISVASIFADPSIASEFDALFVWCVTVVAGGGGFVIGALMNGRPRSGLHHSFIMMATGYLLTMLALTL